MNELLLVAIVCLSNIVCFVVGAKGGQKANPVEGIKLISSAEKSKAFKVSQNTSEEQKAVEDMLHNIDVYDGTSLGQRDIRL